MKLIREISIIFATLLIVVHAFVPHQHKVEFEFTLHNCIFVDSEENQSSNIFNQLEDLIKHIDLGENNLDEFKLSTTDYEILQKFIFINPDFFLNVNFCLENPKKKHVKHYYTFSNTSTENQLENPLRAPPFTFI